MGRLRLVIPRPTGSCSGVSNALAFLPLLRANHPNARIFVNHPTVHHPEEESLRMELNIPLLSRAAWSLLQPRDIVVGSAHGTPAEEVVAIKATGAIFADATCPLVAANYGWLTWKNAAVIYVGKDGDREADATRSRANGKEHLYFLDLYRGNVEEVAEAIRISGVALPILIVRQTTIPENDPDFVRIQQTIAELLSDFSFLRNQGECYATQNRQQSLILGIEQSKPEVVLVLTAEKSSNGKALVATARSSGILTLYAEDTGGILECVRAHAVCFKASTILLVAAASVTESIIQETARAICAWSQDLGRECEVEEPWLIDRNKEPVLKAPFLPILD